MGIKRKRTFGSTLFALLAILSAAALLVSYLALFFNPTEFPLPMFFGLYFIPLLLLNALVLLIAMLKYRRALLIPVIALLPTIFLAERFFKFGREERELSGKNIKVLTYNIGRYSAGSRKVTAHASASGIQRFLAEQNADIVCLQEFAVADTTTLNTYFPSYPYQAKHLFKGKHYFGNLTLSRYPIRDVKSLTFPKSRNLSLVTDIDIDGHTIRVYNCHLESNSLSFTTLIKRIFHKNNFTDEVVQVHGKLREATRRRAAQVDALLQSEAASPYPNLVCGDFNDTPMSYTYHRLVQTKKDSFVEAGTNFAATYSVLWPMLRVDYILLPQEYAADRHETLRVPWSDHYPVTTYIYLDK